MNPRLACGTDDANRGVDLQVVLGLSPGLSFLQKSEKVPIRCKEAPLLTLLILTCDFMIGLGLDVFDTSTGE